MRTTTPIAALAALAVTLTACGDNDDATRATTGSTAPPTVPAKTAAATTTDPPEATPTTVPASTVTASTGVIATTDSRETVPMTTAPDETWRELADAACAHWLPVVVLPPPGSDQASLEAYAHAHLDAWESAPDISAIDLPPGSGRTPADLAALVAGQKDALDDAVAAAAAGDAAATVRAIDLLRRQLGAVGSALAIAGQSCGPADAAVAAQASLNVTMVAPWQLETGYGSVWVSQDLIDTVARIDPDTGQVLASIAMPSRPGKLQPADGRMLVRTMDSYVAIDATTNTVVGSLLKADVGANADRSWAVDGALWICDGRRLHRYEPTTLQAVAVVELEIECGQVHATSELVTAWTYNEDAGESGSSRAAFVDSATNTVLATVDLASDAGVPIVLDDTVFLPPQGGSQATVVDRSTWTVTATPDLGRPIEMGSQGAFDGSAIYLIADKPTGTIAVVDPTTFQITGEIRALTIAPSLNSLAATPGVLWAVINSGGLLQRFDAAG